MKPIFLSSPHSGEMIPEEVIWLSHLPETILMCDVDRYVDRLYAPGCERLAIPFIVTPWHRYVVDLNREPQDIDGQCVVGAVGAVGKEFVSALHWVRTTKGDLLMPQPMAPSLHERLVDKYWRPFHEQVLAQFAHFRRMGHDQIYHLDVHSMPSQGTDKHLDAGQRRPQIVVSDYHGKSCAPKFRDLVVHAYESAGFEVKVNWPYQGGRITQLYGRPELGQHTVQVEMNRALYMDEITKQKRDSSFGEVQNKLELVLVDIEKNLPLI